MSREVCGMCWCTYGDDGRCACPIEEEVSSKPVAWLWSEDGCNLSVNLKKDYQHDIPLYTHPVKEQLTEEQVIDITKAFFNIHPETQLSEKFSIPLYELTHFARAILRKAQEK